MDVQQHYWRYWGKTQIKPSGQGPQWHLLACHALDVAAVMAQLLADRPRWLARCAKALGWPVEHTAQVLCFFAVLHDLGKFARAFQGLFRHDSPDLAPWVAGKAYTLRHDSLGRLLWQQTLCARLADLLPADDDPEDWLPWLEIVFGHHGEPALDEAYGSSRRVDEFFCPDDIDAAEAFCRDMAAQLLPDGLPSIADLDESALLRWSWPLAGLMVLADWLGSDSAYFPYQASPLPLAEYWALVQSRAQACVAGAGVRPSPTAEYVGPAALTQLFDYLHDPTPLQHWAATAALPAEPQLLLLEDVTGAGKTEAALILAHRLMAVGQASGLYFALPTMATANQMYHRVGQVYRRLYADHARPAIVLAHAARQLVEAFRLSQRPADAPYSPDEDTASLLCHSWLADSQKKSLLADVGVGSIDQALLAVLPARHQSLRQQGLADKVLICDEIHAFDTYVRKHLLTLLEQHARLGGSAILLSATLPANLRAELAQAFANGRNRRRNAAPAVPADARYPLITHVHTHIDAHACATRPHVARQVRVAHVHELDAVLALIADAVAAGQCVAWIRNTVEDAREAWAQLCASLPGPAPMLFHSRYVMADRLEIEGQVLDALGKTSGPAQRRGRVVVGSQVLEQSLDYDVDIMISDLAPIDLLIQRAGRLQRHARHADGQLSADGQEHRPAPVFYVFGPALASADKVDIDWYARSFPRGQYVYPATGQLWLAQQALHATGCIVSPGELGQPGAVRQLMEAVYGEHAGQDIPAALHAAEQRYQASEMGKAAMARINALNLNAGYCRGSSRHWGEELRIPTRLGEGSAQLFLARLDGERLRPWRDEGEAPWPMSAVRVTHAQLCALAAHWQARFAAPLAAAQEEWPWLTEHGLLMPMVADAHGDGVGHGVDDAGREVVVSYSRQTGLRLVRQ